MPGNMFSVNSDKQDVEALLENVAERVRRWEGGEEQSLDLSIMLGETEKASHRAAQLKAQWNIDGSAIVQSTRPGLGPWIMRFQRLVRRLSWWYAEPILQQIRAFHRSAAVAIDGLAQNQERLVKRYEDLEADHEALRQRVEDLEGRLSEVGEHPRSDADGKG
jgi:hypothetical protein